MMTHQQAVKLSREVHQKLPNKELWKAHVWENLGYHCAWYRGAVQLHCDDNADDPTFWAMIGDPREQSAGHIDLTNNGSDHHFKDPEEAICAAIRYAMRVYNNRYLPILSSLQEVLCDL